MGEFGLQNILDIPNGPLPSTGEKFTLQDNVEVFLKVLVYDASGEFLIERTFGKTGVDENNLQFSYFIPYDGLSLEQDLLSSGLQINLQQILKEMELPQGNYYLVTNLIHFIDVASSVAAISTDRTEIQFNGVPGQSDASNTYFGENVLPQHLGFHKLDIGFGRFRRMLNWTVDSLDLITKLDAPLPNDVFGGGTYPLYMDITDPTKMYIEWEVEGDSITYPFLAPNFDIKVRSGTPAATEFKTSNDITGTVKETKDKLINKYLSSSYGEIELNIDYKDPSQYIHFSSYEERLLNFKYKLQLIEKYDLEVSASNTITGDVASSDAVVLDKNTSIRKRDEVISTFDTFENYMYFESSSHVSGTLGDFWSNTWPKSTTVKPHRIFATTSSEANEWLTGAIQSASLYDRNNPNMLSKALPEYVIDDPLNSTIITLSDMIGQHYDVVWTYVKGITDISVRDESLSTGIAKNLLWHVGTSMGMKLPNGNAAEDLWKYALGTDESGSLASSGTGFESGSLPQLSSEDVTKNIWSRLINNMPYFLRTKGTTRGVKAVLACYGVPDTIIDIKEYGGPKGLNDTERQTLTEQRTVYNPRIVQGETFQLKSTKATITEQAPRAFQFRFKTTNKQDMVLLEKNGVPWFINIHHSGSITQTVQNKGASANIPQIALGERTEKGIYGRLTFLITGSLNYDGGKEVPAESQILSASTPYLPLYNGDWWNVTLQTEVSSSTNATTDNTTQNQKWILDCRSAKDHSNGRITHSGSATLENHSGSYSASFNNTWRQFGADTYWNFGGFLATSNATRYNDTGVRGTGGTVKQFSGSFQEIRLWTSPEKLEDRVLDIQTLSPRTIVGNNFSSSYDHLVARFPLGTQFKKSNLSGSVVTSTHPQSTLSWTTAANVLTASAFSNDTTGSDGTHFDVSTETYYTTIPSYPSNGPSSVKVRLEDNALIGQLNHNKRAEISEYDRHPKDTNTIGVHLSLQHQINRDIAYQFGDIRVDDFIGDPEHQYLPNYPDLEQLQKFYFKKVFKISKNKFNTYCS